MRISDWSSDVCSSDLFTVVGTDKRVTLAQAARAAKEDQSLPEEMRGTIDGQHHLVAGTQTYPNGCHLCELEADPDTGPVKLLRYVVSSAGRRVGKECVSTFRSRRSPVLSKKNSADSIANDKLNEQNK